MDTCHSNPKTLCANMAFHSSGLPDFFRRFASNLFSTGPYTPWPNQKEATIRVCKATLFDLCAQLGSSPELRQVTVRELVEENCCSEVCHGNLWRKTPVELAFGRRSRDVVTIENSSQEQRTTPETPRDLANQTLKQFPMKSYLEARQRADLRRDIAASLLPSERHFAPRDRVQYWQLKKCKIKQRTMSGRWSKAWVLSQEGAICVMDTSTTVLRVSQSKRRQEKGAWNDAALSPDSSPPPPPSDSAPREQLDVPREQAIDQLPGQGAPDVYWIVPRGAPTDFMEL